MGGEGQVGSGGGNLEQFKSTGVNRWGPQNKNAEAATLVTGVVMGNLGCLDGWLWRCDSERLFRASC